MTCPDCGNRVVRVLYYGLSHRLCEGEDHHLDGPFMWLTARLPFSGSFILYEKGQYWSALWAWLTGQV